MKKLIIAFILGALVMFSGQAIADTVSQIGKKVDSEASVFVNGEKVSDAIIIKGVSYTPSRDVAERLGAKVEWKGSENSIMIVTESVNRGTDEEINEEIERIVAEKEERNYIDFEELMRVSKLKTSIESAKQNIENYERRIEKLKLQISDDIHPTINKSYENQIKEYETWIIEETANLAQLEKEYAKLESAK